jgi:uncharacterized membrane protein YfcA
MGALIGLLAFLAVFAVVFMVVFFRDALAHKSELATGADGVVKPLWISGVIGGVTNFFDTLGIGSFAPTTAAFKGTKVVDDGVIPGTLNVAHTLPVVVMAFLYIILLGVYVDIVTLIALIAAAVVGSWLGAGVVAKFNRTRIQFVIGVALFLVASVMAARNAGIIDGFGAGNVATGLRGGLLIVGIISHFILGALMTAGVGLYAPSMAVVYLLGLSPAVAFPVMMGACAFLMPVAGIKFVKEGKYARKQSVMIGLCGIIGVIVAFQFFRGVFQLGMLIWLVIVVIFITSILMLRSAMSAKKAAK